VPAYWFSLALACTARITLSYHAVQLAYSRKSGAVLIDDHVDVGMHRQAVEQVKAVLEAACELRLASASSRIEV
jgi:alpha-glucuronidase